MFVLTDVLTVGLAAGAVSVTITRSQMGAPIRRFMQGLGSWASSLMQCPYCLVHWIALPLTMLTVPRSMPMAAVGTYLASIGVGGVLAGLLDALVFRPRDEAARERAALVDSISQMNAALNKLAEERDV